MKRTYICAFVAMVIALCSTNHAKASVIVSLQNSGSNVVATYSGTLNLSGLSSSGGGAGWTDGIQPSTPVIALGSQGSIAFTYYQGFNGPASFGSGLFTAASAGSGTNLCICGSQGIAVASGFSSGGSISGTTTWNSTSLSSLGVTPGIYTYSWSGDSISLYAGVQPPVATPEPSTGMLLMTAGLAAIAMCRLKVRRGR